MSDDPKLIDRVAKVMLNSELSFSEQYAVLAAIEAVRKFWNPDIERHIAQANGLSVHMILRSDEGLKSYLEYVRPKKKG